MNILAPTRRQLLAGAAATLLPIPAFASTSSRFGFAPVEVANGIWMIEGAREVFSRENGGAIVNIAFIETPQGAVVVDTGSNLSMGQEIRAFAEERLGGVALVVNTHHHPDHWFGNAAFDDCRIVALEETISTCTQYAQDFAESLYAILGSWMRGTNTRPGDSPMQGGEARIGGRSMRFIALSGHTQADLAILDEETGTLIAGDLLFLDRAPSLPDADFAAWNAALDELQALAPSGTVPGHGPFDRTDQALVQTRAYLTATRARLDQAAALGLSPIEAMSAGPVPEFAGLGANPEEYLRSVVQRWADHETEALPLIGGL
ncbi:quinoprotein relay system zinc metallohydrolase 1 [Paracoccus caeni]|uniref:Quinoprotein relay system zinc metallohydrolase 1 n=1 Tax=Paracoccus caeni TaxID=657651 RepID=A0A934W163_9RHOB|nr:quinoprotein relay system zinc metallohydrolase 1 [Paracoccus caeni]MBK4217665.1 quinoprotein relay system zinc metallohydrolase 1 [Paracoccus caeni]